MLLLSTYKVIALLDNLKLVYKSKINFIDNSLIIHWVFSLNFMCNNAAQTSW